MIDNTTPAADPHGLRETSEPLATGAELRARFGISGSQLRYLRKHRRVRYVDRHPDLPPATEASDRYLYAVGDVAKEGARIEAARATAPPSPPPEASSPPPPASKAPAPSPPKLRPHARANLSALFQRPR